MTLSSSPYPNGGFGVEFATANADTTFTRYTLSGGQTFRTRSLYLPVQATVG